MSERPLASLSLDLDNKWAYLRAAGRESWESSTSYFPSVIPRIVETLGALDLPLTVFLVGRDLGNHADVKSIAGFAALPKWEAANHSFNHLPWMHTMSDAEIETEIRATGERIVEATGQNPVGFRGPGFSCPEAVLRVLGQLGYRYDASIFPTSIAPIARAVFLARTELRGEQREQAKQLYGGWASMRNPNRPYQRALPGLQASLKTGASEKPDPAGAKIWEIPVTVMPILRTPIHFSYLTFVAGYSVTVAKAYFRSALSMCRWFGVTPSLLLHPLDFLGCEDDLEMAYFPGMKMSRTSKLQFITWALSLYHEQFHVQTLGEHHA